MKRSEAFKAFLSGEDTAAFHDSDEYRRHLATWEAAVAWKEQQDLAAVEVVRSATYNRFVGGDQAACAEIQRRIKKGDG